MVKTIFKFIALTLLFSILTLTSCKENKTPVEKNEITNIATLEYKINSKLGEGAIWNYKTEELYWVDIEGQTLNIYNPKTKNNNVIKTPSKIGTVVPYTKQQAVIALEDGIYQVNLDNGKLNQISNIEASMTENRFNDGKCDPQGNFWVGSMHLKESSPKASLYKVAPNGTTTKMIDSVTISNGIVWSKDAKTMYYIDTPTKTIKSYNYDIKTSTISNEKVAVNVPESLGYPDGMTIDQNDMLWVALWNGNAVAQFNPKTGQLISKIEVPAHNVTSCAFGGKNLDVLYITTSTKDMTNEEREKYPLAGSIFKYKPEAKGRPAFFFKEAIR
ncbi:sugar lactone lactonase YvrE [Mesoflavibacter sabulilitoris]|uniref:Regucalcin n=1 Tax=Mesoflavibacter zeaxanthinifaciens subsp. sabulilitoris TaxID=1520893 RepID=A0A2T1NID9_9FLAO|nr:SMP-30/gluconolactonase/LRE family protein [Mesoflavibacter zeaxanthinifaciens]MBB3124287.1 sugar lactone lactonase YvrE [Mesoflavibacter zeaxanthinifaciens subsp. sabulilitoris]PSG92610.1 regucalcin [Mesoflavibacter zeaxanthinifaciens subsp. sabulilitoris]